MGSNSENNDIQNVAPSTSPAVLWSMGSAAIVLLLLRTIRNSGWAVAYLLAFRLGAIAEMMLITAAISLPFTFPLQRFARLNRGIAAA